MKVRPGVEVVCLTDVGCQRENNEDSFAYWESPDDSVFARLGRLAVVADGMGGAEGGQFASQIAVETVQEHYSAGGNDPQQLLLDAFQLANSRVQERARENPSLQGMGTTLTAVVVADSHLYFAHVGDSRVYLERDGKIRVLTHDHSLVSRLVESGVIRAEDADSHPQRHVLTAAIGVAAAPEPDVPADSVQLQSNDVLLMCTDGLWGQMAESEIAEILSSRRPGDAGKRLISLAKERGGPDNITLQILRIN
jgi:serine/threonine protein phosphatase PrpC